MQIQYNSKKKGNVVTLKSTTNGYIFIARMSNIETHRRKFKFKIWFSKTFMKIILNRHFIFRYVFEFARADLLTCMLDRVGRINNDKYTRRTTICIQVALCICIQVTLHVFAVCVYPAMFTQWPCIRSGGTGPGVRAERTYLCTTIASLVESTCCLLSFIGKICNTIVFLLWRVVFCIWWQKLWLKENSVLKS